MSGFIIMNITVNGKDLNIDTKTKPFTIADLLKYLEIDFWIDVEKNGELAARTDEVVDGDWIKIARFIRGG
jgi:sulfur carrier protein ThiS